MKSKVILEKEAKQKQASRDIVKEIINFGVSDKQKIDIMYFLTLTLEDNNALKEIAEILKKFKIDINKLPESNYKESNNKKLIL